MKKEFRERMESLAKINNKNINEVFEEIGYDEKELTLRGAYKLASEFGVTIGEIADRYLKECTPRWVAKRVDKDIKEKNDEDILRLFAEGLIVNFEGHLYPIALGTNKILKREMISEEDHLKMIDLFLEKGKVREIFRYMNSKDVYPQFEKLDEKAMSYLFIEERQFGIVLRNPAIDFNKAIEKLNDRDKKLIYEKLLAGNQKLLALLQELKAYKNSKNKGDKEIEQFEQFILSNGFMFDCYEVADENYKKPFEEIFSKIKALLDELMIE